MRLTPKEVRVLELAQDVCEKLKQSDVEDDATECGELLSGLVIWAGVKSTRLDDEPK